MPLRGSRRTFHPNAFPAIFFAALSLLPLLIFAAHDGPRQRPLAAAELAAISLPIQP